MCLGFGGFLSYFPSSDLTQGNHNLTIVRLDQWFGAFEELPCSLGSEHHKFKTARDVTQTILNRYT
jgi:hypothetical protein